MRNWILQCSPRVWDVFGWWEEADDELHDWTVSRHLGDIQRGDRFAFWVGGSEAGVYALGTIAGPPRQAKVGGRFWLKPPAGGTSWMVDLQTDQYFFDQPIPKSDLLRDPDFADALVIRMPRTANPIPVTDQQWRAIVGRAGSARRRRPKGPNPRITTRPLGSVVEETTVASAAVERVRTHREAQLVKRYETFVRRPLQVRSVVLASGERLVVDAFDPADDVLIEAKASASREDIRLAIGQLLDYRRHLAPRSRIAVLVPERPSADLVALLQSVPAQIMYETQHGRFRTI